MAEEFKKVHLLQQVMNNSKPLSIVIQEETKKLNGSDSSVEVNNKATVVTQGELVKIKDCSFPRELQFSAEVNLVGSKKAFKSFVGGLDVDVDFHGLWELTSHDPFDYPNPIGDIDMTALNPPLKN